MPTTPSGRGGPKRYEGSSKGEFVLSSPPREEEVTALRVLLVSSVARICPRWLVDHAEDIVQNAVMQLLKSLEKSGGKRRLSSIYLRKAAHGAMVDEIRRRCRRKEGPMPRELSPEGGATTGHDPERARAAREIGRGIAACLKQLIDSRRLAVTLFLRGCSVPETARRLGWSSKKAEHLVSRGLAGLRSCLASKGLAP